MAELVETFENLKIDNTLIVKVKIKNKGIGAGGSKTNEKGKKFEELTHNEKYLLENGYSKIVIDRKGKFGYYLHKKCEETEISFILQSGLKSYCKKFFDIDVFRQPDEAYIIKNNDINKKYIIKILEKKEQSREGSVETKLWAAPSLKREYELVLGNKFIIEYALCISSYLEKKLNNNTPKYNILKEILKENNILIFYGDSEKYQSDINEWCNTF